jgi:16S rRNA (cytosine967-C5)-methyltransferase
VASGYALARGFLPMDARLAAARVLTRVLGSGRRLDSALTDYLEDAAAERRDRALVQELCFGVMRWYFRYDFLLRRWLKRPLKPRDNDIRALILCGLYQLEFLRIPDHAAVAATVEAARALGKPWAAGLINAVLRRFQRESGSLDTVLAASPGAYYAHPDWLLKRLQAQWPDHWQGIVASNNQRPPLHLRVNMRRNGRDAYLAELRRAGMEAEPSFLAATGVYLHTPVDVELLPGFAEGRVSVQDFGAQLAAPLLGVEPGQRVLDACAAPGGKTGHILETAPEGVALTAVEKEPERVVRLRRGMERLGLNAKVIHSDIIQRQGWWDGSLFDRILLDAPCSATGILRRHPDIKVLRTPEQVERLTQLQQQLLESVWAVLKPGGKLLYATCSLLDEEGNGLTERFVQRTRDAMVQLIHADWGVPGSCGRWLVPGMDDSDGFYYAILAKSSE